MKVDDFTLKREKRGFARVFLNLDITKPFRDILVLLCPNYVMQLPISYEGPHEVYVLCGSVAHVLDAEFT